MPAADPQRPATTLAGGLRLGLCCVFREQPIKFRTATATALLRLPERDRTEKLADIARDNAAALRQAILWCADHGIGAFRVNSQVLPLRTHPRVGYAPAELPRGAAIVAAFRRAGELARERGVRLSFHPDQFVVPGSPRPEVVASSLAELEHQAEVAEWIGADTVNIHGGGAQGDRAAALARLAAGVGRLSERARSRLTLENDDRVWRPAELLPVCRDLGLPLVYDVHHHRCLPDGLAVEAATEAALATWSASGREPLFHVSSPLGGWGAADPRRHDDWIDPADFPAAWRRRRLTVEVEAKAKELAVLRLRAALGG